MDLADVYFCMVWLVAGLMTGLTSFGSNLIAVPLITFVLSARDSILVGCLAATLIFLGLGIIYCRNIIWRDTVLLTVGAFAGIPAGIWFLRSAGAKALLLAAGGALLLFLVWQFIAGFLRKTEKPVSSWLAIPLGVASGVMMGGVGMGGPPLVLYIFLRHYDKRQTISTINAASMGIMFGVLPWQYLSGMFPAKILQLGLLGGVCGVAGIALSIPLVSKINIKLFRWLLLAMLFLSAVILLWRGV